MKDPLDRTKVVLRHLPPALSQTMLMEQIDVAFAGRCNWVAFLSGKNSQKQESYSRAYIDFKSREDVIQFAEFFGGHVFVNEKGTQYKILIEYAPSQRVPKQWAKIDGREGTILKDPEYLEFLESIEKPVENLPSAEIQLERREVERAGAAKDSPIVTPLMDFVRQKRAAKSGSRRLLSNGKPIKPSRRAGGSSTGSPSHTSSNRGSEKRKTRMCFLRESARNADGKDKSTYNTSSKREDESASEVLEEENGVSGITDTGKKKILLLKGKEREILNVSGGISQRHTVTSVKNLLGSTALKQSQEREGGRRIIKSILLNKDPHQSQSSGVQFEHPDQISSLDKEKQSLRTQHAQLVLKDNNGSFNKKVTGNEFHGSEKQKRTRNKDRPDRGVWTFRRSEGSHASNESFSSTASHPTQPRLDFSEGTHGDVKVDSSNERIGEVKTHGCGRSGHFYLDNGSRKHVARRGPTLSIKDVDGLLVTGEGKLSKRGGTSGHGSHEKQVWVQKSNSGS